jgi:hypothetical protein
VLPWTVWGVCGCVSTGALFRKRFGRQVADSRRVLVLVGGLVVDERGAVWYDGSSMSCTTKGGVSRWVRPAVACRGAQSGAQANWATMCMYVATQCLYLQRRSVAMAGCNAVVALKSSITE